MKIQKTQITKPPRIVIYGQHGLGKSTFGSECPKPIFLQTEDGVDALGVEAFEKALDLKMVHDQLDYLLNNNVEYKTLVIDSLDWLEKLIWQSVCNDVGANDIAAIPFGRGYVMAEKKWKEVLDKVNRLNIEKKIMPVLLAHAQVKRFEDPERESYDRYQLDLQNKAAALVCEYADIVGFMSYKVAVTAKEGKFGASTVKARSSGDRVLYLEERPAFTAKNRFKMDDMIDVPEGHGWQAMADQLKRHKKKQGNLVAVVEKKVQDDLAKIGA